MLRLYNISVINFAYTPRKLLEICCVIFTSMENKENMSRVIEDNEYIVKKV